MADLPSHPDTGSGDAGADPDRRPTPRRPRWTSVAGITLGIALVVLFVVLHLTGVLGPGGH